MIALITKRNNPKVRIVAGRVRRMSKGFTNASKMASTNATIMAVRKSDISTPGRRYASKNALTAIMRIFKTKFTGAGLGKCTYVQLNREMKKIFNSSALFLKQGT